jgi:predicted metal-dependent enzyme (double-stranded beta helix superfamily)
MNNPTRLRSFIQSFTCLVDQAGDDVQRIFADGKMLLLALISHDDWLPEDFALPHPDRYQQYLLHCDPMERFSVVSFVWGPDQTTPVHDHTVWGMVGVMRGAEICEDFDRDPDTGRLQSRGTHHLASGGIDLVSTRVGDIHQVSNAFTDRTSVSIHIYGAIIGAVQRHVYDVDTGRKTPFVSG